METPFIIIDGEKIEPAAPKMKVWRAFLKSADRDRSKEQLDDFLKEQIDLIVLAFGKPDVVNESTIDENLEIADVVPMVRKLFKWIQIMTFTKLASSPNGETEEA
ncbi:hypothetical protein D081_2217 [Anaerovibrio sp. JC8]|uniref:hypothetical protein n=1 Tax=Anaerovibrio sp. JC8 TaxID=1240085 RepID=UPI000A0EAB3A|nr:hypothetical protein [Anaerovibrio sp. JC8]ORT99038.1 hypothetical protein D081_2217 [Anaerovibrio sp. JC8]